MEASEEAPVWMRCLCSYSMRGVCGRGCQPSSLRCGERLSGMRRFLADTPSRGVLTDKRSSCRAVLLCALLLARAVPVSAADNTYTPHTHAHTRSPLCRYYAHDRRLQPALLLVRMSLAESTTRLRVVRAVAAVPCDSAAGCPMTHSGTRLQSLISGAQSGDGVGAATAVALATGLASSPRVRWVRQRVRAAVLTTATVCRAAQSSRRRSRATGSGSGAATD